MALLSERGIAVEVVNKMAMPIYLFWQNPSTGLEVFQRRVSATSKSRLTSFPGHAL